MSNIPAILTTIAQYFPAFCLHPHRERGSTIVRLRPLRLTWKEKFLTQYELMASRGAIRANRLLVLAIARVWGEVSDIPRCEPPGRSMRNRLLRWESEGATADEGGEIPGDRGFVVAADIRNRGERRTQSRFQIISFPPRYPHAREGCRMSNSREKSVAIPLGHIESIHERVRAVDAAAMRAAELRRIHCK